ncbi:MAG: gamma-glutamyl-gamma-aminobutyrate hydrolase family protein [Pirellulaceae bacterium]
MQRKPLIGINADYRNTHQGVPAYSYLAAGYYDNILAAGGIPVVVPPMEDDQDLSDVLDMLQGFVLIGGADLDPRNDGYMLHSSVRPMDARRESFDRKLMASIAQRRMPVFGIGTGHQLINVHLGGNLFFHLPIDLPEAIQHRDINDPNHRHSLVVESDSIVGRVYGEGEIRVTSRHHMAIDQLAPGLRVTARCQDGVIEAFESEMEDWMCIGVQFHPESPAASALDVRIFEEFVEGVVRYQAQPLRLVG